MHSITLLECLITTLTFDITFLLTHALICILESRRGDPTPGWGVRRSTNPWTGPYERYAKTICTFLAVVAALELLLLALAIPGVKVRSLAHCVDDDGGVHDDGSDGGREREKEREKECVIVEMTWKSLIFIFTALVFLAAYILGILLRRLRVQIPLRPRCDLFRPWILVCAALLFQLCGAFIVLLSYPDYYVFDFALSKPRGERAVATFFVASALLCTELGVAAWVYGFGRFYLELRGRNSAGGD